MNVRYLLVYFTVILTLPLLTATPNYANGVRGASGYGVNGSTCSVNSASNCQNYTQGSFTISGQTYNGDVFTFVEPDSAGSGMLDILQFNTNSSLSFNLTSLSASTGVFACGSGSSSSVAQDSTGASLSGLRCTQGGSDSGYFDPNQTINGITETISGSEVTFTNTTGSPAAIFATYGDISGATFTPGAVATPEPSSLVLLGMGLLALSIVGLKSR
jgi:hypothetical protein